MDNENKCIKIIIENENKLSFEAYPAKYVDMKGMYIVFAIYLIIVIYSLVIKFLSIQLLIGSIIFWIIVFVIYRFIYAREKVIVEIDKPMDLIKISGFYKPSYFGVPIIFKHEPASIPIKEIAKIEYETIWWSFWNGRIFRPLQYIANYGEFKFFLNNNSIIKLYTFGPLASFSSFGEVGKKIADFIKVSFRM